MDKKVKISVESGADIPADVLETRGINNIPVYVIAGNQSYYDVIDITPYQMFEMVEKEKISATTSAPSEHDYYESFSKLHEEGMDVVHVSTTSSASVCYQNAVNAGKRVGDVWVVDSRNATSGVALLALYAADLAALGKNAKEIYSELLSATSRIEMSCILDTLSYVLKGGRIISMAAKGVELLNLKPCVELRNGKLSLGKKYRGKLEHVLMRYVRDRLADRTDIDLKRVFIANSLLDKTLIKPIIDLVKSLQPFEEVLVADVGCAISCHAGPNALGVIFMRKS
jgi:DegV family protein with EDD domain